MRKFILKIQFILIIIVSPFLAWAETSEKVAEHAKEPAGILWRFLTDLNFSLKYYVMILIGAVVIFLILKKKLKPSIRIPILIISTLLFGIIGNISLKPFSSFSMHPSPMCVTKALLYGFGIPFIITLAVILLLTLIGPRIFCGYICPVGAIQELVSSFAKKLGIKQRHFSFSFSQVIRLGLFIAFIFLSATAVIHVVFEGEVYPSSLYDYINAFHGLEFSIPKDLFTGLVQYLPLVLTIILAFRFYRPFCHFVCPIGLFTHWAEQISLFRIRLNKQKCTSCNICVKESPCEAVDDILKESTLQPDCYGCLKCIELCPENALSVRSGRLNINKIIQ